MADNGVLHELKVAIRVALSGYKKDMEAVKKETKKSREAINSETGKINTLMGKVSTQKARKEIEKLTGQLNRQKEKISNQEILVSRLNKQYEDLISGMSQDRSVSGLEKQLKSAEKEFETIRDKLFKLYDAYDIAEAASKNGGGNSGLAELSEQIDEIEPRYESLGKRVASLKEKLQQVKMNPESSASAQDMAAKIEAETKKLERMKNEAGTVKEKLDAILHSKAPPTAGKQLSKIISKIKELAKSAKSSSVQTANGFDRMEKAIGKAKSRISNLVGSVLVFEVLRKGLVALRNQMSGCLKTNQEFTASLNIVKTNLQVSFASIYTAALPAVNALMSALAYLSTAMATLLSGLFGKTYSESLKTAQGLKTATSALNGYGSAAKNNQTFSFDEVHNITKDEGSGGGAALEDTSMMIGETEAIIENIKNKFSNVFAPFMEALGEISEATAIWIKGVDFNPITEAFNGLMEAITPLITIACEGLVWMYKEILLPFASWSIEDAVPAFFDLLSATLAVINSVLTVFQPLGMWLWNSFLQPIAQWTGGIICEVLEILADLLTTISDWITEHQVLLETLVIIIGSIAAAVGLVNAAILIWNVIGNIGTVVMAALSAATAVLAVAIAFLTSPIGIAIAAIAALIAAGILLYKNWDTVKEKAVSIWNAIKDTIKGVINSILEGIESMCNGVIKGINFVINALNGLHFDIPDWVPELGGKTFGFNIPTLSTVTLPRLAKGGIVDGLTPLIAGEAGKEAIIPLENNTGWIEMISARISDFINDRIADRGAGGEYSDLDITIPITLELDGETLLKKLIKVYKRRGYPIVVEGV